MCFSSISSTQDINKVCHCQNIQNPAAKSAKTKCENTRAFFTKNFHERFIFDRAYNMDEEDEYPEDLGTSNVETETGIGKSQ